MAPIYGFGVPLVFGWKGVQLGSQKFLRTGDFLIGHHYRARDSCVKRQRKNVAIWASAEAVQAVPEPAQVDKAKRKDKQTKRVRVVHFTDVHFYSPAGFQPSTDLLSKKTLGFLNAELNKSGRAFDPDRLVPVFARTVLDIAPDLVIFSGDLTTLSTEAEFAVARETLEPLLKSGLPVVMIPGNHDRYTPDAALRMEHYFGDWMAGGSWTEGRWVADAQTGPWPKLFEVDGLGVIGLDHCRPGVLSSGSHSNGELARLKRILQLRSAPRPRPTLVVGHYPLLDTSGQPYRKLGRSLTDRDQLEDIISSSATCAYLSGHEHRWYVQALPRRTSSDATPQLGPIHLLGCGSTTHVGEDASKRAGFFSFEVAWDGDLNANSGADADTDEEGIALGGLHRHQWNGARFVRGEAIIA